MVAQEEDRDLTLPLVNDDLGYPIVIGEGLRVVVAEFVRERATPVVVLCDADPNVRRVARRVSAAAGARSLGIVAVPLGEARKNLVTLERTLDALAASGADRTTLVIGVGGGVAADLFGMAAATFMRGVAYAHVATTLVAMVDAAIGGKTGVDLRGGKNLAGVFKDPIAVFCEIASAADAAVPLPARRPG